MAPFDETLLDDSAARASIDREDLLRQLAGAGARVREADALTTEVSGLAGLTGGERPRAVHIASVGGADLAADLAALLARASGVLVSTGGSGPLPGWVGPLDLVIAISLGGAARGPVEQASEAARRGAMVLTVGRAGGPLAESSARARGVHVDIVTRGEVRPRRTRTAVWGLLVPVLRGLVAAGLVAEEDVTTEALADTLDAVAEEARPDAEYFVNPAKTLALDLSTHTPLVLADGPITAVAARRASLMLHRTARTPASVGELPHDAGEIVACLSGPQGGLDTSADDIFNDPFVDGDSTGRPLGLLLLRDADECSDPDQRALAEAVRRGADGVHVRVIEQRAVVGPEVVRVARVVGMLDFAATYLAIGHRLDPASAPGLDDLASDGGRG